MPRPVTVLLDMDGVLCDFVKRTVMLCGLNLTRVINHWNLGQYETAPNLGLSDEVMWSTIMRDPSFWLSLEETPWLRGLLEIFEECELRVCSKPSNHDVRSASNKITWLQQHQLGHISYHLTHLKEELAAPHRILIDDCDDHCQKFREAGGHAIVLPQPWNSSFPFVFDRLGQVEVEFQAILDELGVLM